MNNPWLALLALGTALTVITAQAAPSVHEAEPGRLPADVVPVHYAIHVAPNAKALTFTGEARITVEAKASVARIVLNAADLAVTRAQLDGRAVPFTLDAATETLTLTPAQPVAPGRHQLRLQYTGKIYQAPSGLFAVDYPHEGKTRRMLSSQFEPGDARRLAPMWDEPERKATFDVSVLIPRGQSAYGNMPVKARQLRGGQQWVSFRTTPRMSSYLLHLSVGELERLSTTVAGVDVGIVTRRGVKQQGRFALQATVESLRLFNDFFGTPYPLPKLDVIAVPTTSQSFGAMENWGAIMFMEHYLLLEGAEPAQSDLQNVFTTVAHEVSHQWFGNLVTMRWWDDLWLNEGFATWMEYSATQALHPQWKPWERMAAEVRERALRVDARATTHAIVQPVATSDAARQAFDSIAYFKSVNVIRMIEAVAGADAFRDGLRAYMKRHAYGNTVTDDLWAELERTAAQPIRTLALDFATQPGVPLLRVQPEPCADGSTPVTLSQARFETAAAADRDPQPRRWHLPVKLRTVAGEGPAGATTTVLLDGPSTRVLLAGCGPVLANAGGIGYFRTLYEPAAAQALGAAFARLPTVDQLVRLSDTWALGENGDAPVGDWLDLVAHLPADADPLVLLKAVQTLRLVDRLYSPSPEQPLLWAFARGRLRPAFDRIGWLRRDGEPDNAALLREELITALGHFGDPDVIAGARARFKAGVIGTDETQLPAAIRQPVLDVVAEQADAATWELIAAQAQATTSAAERRRLLQALGAAADPALAQRALDFALQDKAEPPLRAAIIAATGQLHPDLALRFGVAHHDQIAPMLEGMALWVFVPRLASLSTDPASIDALTRYMEARIPADSRVAARQALEAMRLRAQVKAQRVPEVTAWLKAH